MAPVVTNIGNIGYMKTQNINGKVIAWVYDCHYCGSGFTTKEPETICTNCGAPLSLKKTLVESTVSKINKTADASYRKRGLSKAEIMAHPYLSKIAKGLKKLHVTDMTAEDVLYLASVRWREGCPTPSYSLPDKEFTKQMLELIQVDTK